MSRLLKKQRIWAGIFAMALVFTVSGCGGTSTSSQGPASHGGETGAPSGGPTKVSIMVGGLEKIIYLPAMLTQRLGYFKEQGLEVSLHNETAGQTAEEALLAHQVDAVVGFYDHSVDLQSKGKYIQSVILFDQVPGEVLTVSTKTSPPIKSLADLKGKRIGVTGLGSSTNFLANYLVVKGGSPASSYSAVPVGAGQTLIAAMQQGRIDAAVTTEPTSSLLEKQGLAKVLVDMRNMDSTRQALGGTYPAACLYLNIDFIQQHPDTVQKMVNAFAKTLAYIHSHSAKEIAAQMPSEYYGGDKELYVTALQNSLPMFSADGKMPADGPTTVLKVMSTFNKKLDPSKIDLSKTYTDEFVSKVNP